jgi:hypothetical protein
MAAVTWRLGQSSLVDLLTTHWDSAQPFYCSGLFNTTWLILAAAGRADPGHLRGVVHFKDGVLCPIRVLILLIETTGYAIFARLPDNKFRQI